MPEGVSDYAVGHDAGVFAGGNMMFLSSEDDASIVHEIAYAEPVMDEDEEEAANENYVFVTVETMPQFPGGDIAVLEYIKNNLVYPEAAKENGIQGRVVVSFVVEVDGSISEVTVVRGVDPQLDAEAIRLIKSMPNWKPGMQRGKPVRVKYQVPVRFQLQ